jgi:hypothetical protein
LTCNRYEVGEVKRDIRILRRSSRRAHLTRQCIRLVRELPSRSEINEQNRSSSRAPPPVIRYATGMIRCLGTVAVSFRSHIALRACAARIAC